MKLANAIVHTPHIDILARVLSITSLAVALGSLLLTWLLWKRSGGELTATLKGFGPTQIYGSEEHGGEQIVFDVDVINVGRMPAVVRSVTVYRLKARWQFKRPISWWYRLWRRNWAIGTSAYPVEKDDSDRSPEEIESRYPKEILPTAYLKVRAYMDADLVQPWDRWAQAIVIRGDNRGSYSQPIPIPRPASRKASTVRRSRP